MDPPTLLKRPIGDEPLRMRVFSAKTAQTVRSMMRLVVSHKDGTGNFADAPGYLVGGKTGTSEKVGIGGYDKKANIATFAATFPVHEPRYVLVILVDEPQGQTFVRLCHSRMGRGTCSSSLLNRLPHFWRSSC